MGAKDVEGKGTEVVKESDGVKGGEIENKRIGGIKSNIFSHF